MAKPQATAVAQKRLRQITESFEQHPDTLQVGLILSDLDYETIAEVGAEGDAALLAVLRGSINRGRQGDHLFAHALVHIPSWLRDRLDAGEAAKLVGTALSLRNDGHDEGNTEP